MEEKLLLLYPALDEEVIALAVEQAQSFILDFCNLKEVPTALNSTLLEMCKQDLNKLKSEGVTSESAGGSSVSYETDYTDKIYKTLRKHRKIRLVKSEVDDG